MILVGSRAANLSGFLPEWRRGIMVDYDFHASTEEVKSIHELMMSKNVAYESRVDRLGNTHFLDGAGLRISAMTPDRTSDAILNCRDSFPSYALGMKVLCLGPVGQLAMKMGYVRIPGHNQDKNKNDIDFWLKKIKPCSWFPEHTKLMNEVWNKVESIFETEKVDMMRSSEVKTLVKLGFIK